MSNAKEIQKRIKSVQDTMKITKAMYMMSSMKLRKAKQQLADAEPYFFGLQQQIADILFHFPEMEHLYFDNREEDRSEYNKRKGYIIITGDKGMAGAYNHNILKETEDRIRHLREKPMLFVVGEAGRRYLSARGWDPEPDFMYSSYRPTVHRARLISELVMELYQQEQLDEVYITYTRMVNSIKMEVETRRLLPLPTKDFIGREDIEGYEEYKHLRELEEKNILKQEEAHGVAEDEYLIYPSPVEMLESMVRNYVTGYIYGALVESSASEENARMMAMQSATDNAEELLRTLHMEHNQVRQAAITQEITEVIGGAKALKKKKEKMKAKRRAMLTNP